LTAAHRSGSEGAARSSLRVDRVDRHWAGAAAPSLRVLQESQIEGYKHQDNADVHYQPLPESILKEQKIYTNDNGYHHHNVKHGRHVPCHFNHQFKYINSRLPMKLPDCPLNPLGLLLFSTARQAHH
jgi:hypothetical protein